MSRDAAVTPAVPRPLTTDSIVDLDATSLLAGARFEVLPFDSALQQLAAVAPETPITITCSPRHGIGRTLAFAERVQAHGFRVIPHIAARMVRDADDLARIAERLKQRRMEEILVIGGDHREPLGRYADSLHLLEDLAPLVEGVRIGIAGYPAGHPAIAQEQLTAALLSKQPFASVIVTQICFDAAAIASWIRSIRAAGVRLPILVGVPGVVDRRKLLELSARVGVGASTRYLRNNLTLARLLVRRSTYRPDRLIDRLGAPVTAGLGVAGLHIFTFNQLAATSAWRDNTDLRRNRR
jgi:methylenetetrahydrofolate reductase (NADPH)